MTKLSYSLHHGNCISVLSAAPASSVDLVVTDPPYVCRFRDRSGRVVANDNNSDWIEPAFLQVARVLKPDSFCLSFYGWGHVEKFMKAWKAAGLEPVGHIVWAKNYASKKGFLAAQHEQAFLLAKGHPAKPDEPLGDVRPWKYTGNQQHPTQKAVDILKPLIAAFSKPGDVVLDPFMGSGSTGIAALEAGRKFIGIELEEEHFRTAYGRLQTYRQGQMRRPLINQQLAA